MVLTFLKPNNCAILNLLQGKLMEKCVLFIYTGGASFHTQAHFLFLSAPLCSQRWPSSVRPTGLCTLYNHASSLSSICWQLAKRACSTWPKANSLTLFGCTAQICDCAVNLTFFYMLQEWCTGGHQMAACRKSSHTCMTWRFTSTAP